jgi:hypothetical protein
MRLRSLGSAFAFLALAAPLSAQESPLTARCPGGGQERTVCLAVAQAVESAQPQIGMVIAGGNPILGATGGGGLRFGVIPRVDLSARANLVFVRLPDILAAEGGSTVQRLNDRLGIPAPALAVNGSVGVFPGFGILPGVGGIGSVDVLAGASWLPFRTFDVDGFGEEAPDLAWGVGARVGVLRESFITPGISVSVMRRSLGSVGFGDACRGTEVPDPMRMDEFVCTGPGDAGEFAFDLTNWSTRAVAGKRLLGLGLLAGIGHDRYSSDVRYAFRYPDTAPGTSRVVRPNPVDLRSTRWSAFGNLSYTLLLVSLGLEAGWQQGDSPIPGFGQGAGFDPRGGTFFGSAGVRVGF